MTRKIEKLTCRGCGIKLVESDHNGKLHFGKHLKGCPATLVPDAEGPARRKARTRLICGDFCVAPRSDITDLGNGLSHCSRCPSADLAKDATAHHMKATGKKGPVMEIIHPAPRKTVSHWKRLYLDLLQKYAMVLEELEQLKRRSF